MVKLLILMIMRRQPRDWGRWLGCCCQLRMAVRIRYELIFMIFLFPYLYFGVLNVWIADYRYNQSSVITIKVGDQVDYYPPNSVVGAAHNLCSGYINSIYSSDGLGIYDMHLVVGLDLLSYGSQICFPSGSGYWYSTKSRSISLIAGQINDNTSELRLVSDAFKFFSQYG